MTMLTWDELDEGRLLSPKLWKGMAPPSDGTFPTTLSGNPTIGQFDDFLQFGLASGDSGYLTLADATCSVQQIASVDNHYGIVRLNNVGDTSEDEAILQCGAGLDVGPYLFADNDLAFEAYIRVSSVAGGNSFGWYAGLATGGAAGAGITDLLLTAAGAVCATNSFVGFQKLFGESTALDGMYQMSGETKVDGAENTDLDTIQTLVASTWYKLGLRYTASPKKLEWFVDGDSVASISGTTLDAAEFPNDQYMQPTFGLKDEGGDTACALDIDWFACAQLV